MFSEKVYPPEYDGHSQVPLAGVIFSDEFEQHAPDIELLRNLTEKAADINILEVRAFGSMGRVYLGGEERDIDVGWRAAVAAIEGVEGREEE